MMMAVPGFGRCGLRKHLIKLSRGQGREETDTNETKLQWSQTIPRIAVPSVLSSVVVEAVARSLGPFQSISEVGGLNEGLHFNRPHIASRPLPVPGLTLASLSLFYFSLDYSSDCSLFRHWLSRTMLCMRILPSGSRRVHSHSRMDTPTPRTLTGLTRIVSCPGPSPSG